MPTDQTNPPINIPDYEDFLAGNNTYNNKFRNEIEKYPYLFDLICSPESYSALTKATDMSRPAVSGVAKECVNLLKERTESGTTGRINQFIGAVVGFFLLANGYEKTGTQKAVGHRDFTRGEVYRRKG